MLLKYLIRWGVWPARLASAALFIYGAYLVIIAQLALAARADPSAADDSLLNLDLYVQSVAGAVLIGFGALVAVLSWLTRRKSRAAVIGGTVGCFFLAGLIVVYALSANMSGAPLAAVLFAGVGLLLAGGTAVAGSRSLGGGAGAHG
jgi:hypothetical protein